jgi:hypothetical protein
MILVSRQDAQLYRVHLIASGLGRHGWNREGRKEREGEGKTPLIPSFGTPMDSERIRGLNYRSLFAYFAVH